MASLMRTPCRGQEPEEQVPLVRDERQDLRQLVAAHRLRFILFQALDGRPVRKVNVSRGVRADQTLADSRCETGPQRRHDVAHRRIREHSLLCLLVA